MDASPSEVGTADANAGLVKSGSRENGLSETGRSGDSTISAREWSENPTDLPANVVRSMYQRIEIGGHPTGCHVWRGFKDRNGYGAFTPRKSSGIRMGVAHRFVYAHFVGPIPKGMTLDHLCANPSCVNPSHLEPVTLRENVRRSLRRRMAERAAEARRLWGPAS